MEAWLKRVHEEVDFNATYAAWMATLPRPGEIFTPEGMTEQEIAMLQGGYLVRLSTPSVGGCHVD